MMWMIMPGDHTITMKLVDRFNVSLGHNMMSVSLTTMVFMTLLLMISMMWIIMHRWYSSSQLTVLTTVLPLLYNSVVVKIESIRRSRLFGKSLLNPSFILRWRKVKSIKLIKVIELSTVPASPALNMIIIYIGHNT